MIRLIAPTALLALAIWLLGCASTELRDPNTGKVVFRTQADAESMDVTISGGSMRFTVARLIHSMPTAAGGTAAAKIIQSTATLATSTGAAISTSGIVK